MLPAHVQYTKSLCGAAMYRIARGFKIAKNRIFLEVSNLQKKLHSLSDFRSPKAALNWDDGRMRQTMTLEHERKTAQLSNPMDICLRDAIAFLTVQQPILVNGAPRRGFPTGAGFVPRVVRLMVMSSH